MLQVAQLKKEAHCKKKSQVCLLSLDVSQIAGESLFAAA
jgi:hypothetical protein